MAENLLWTRPQKQTDNLEIITTSTLSKMPTTRKGQHKATTRKRKGDTTEKENKKTLVSTCDDSLEGEDLYGVAGLEDDMEEEDTDEEVTEEQKKDGSANKSNKSVNLKEQLEIMRQKLQQKDKELHQKEIMYRNLQKKSI